MKISALMLTKNEEEMISGALSQLSFADEIIVLDKGSQDNTVDAVKKYTDNVHETREEDFDKNRNLLASFAKGEWLLYLDPDERIGRENIAEIKETIKNGNYGAYYFPRNNFILGKHLKHGGWSPDYVPRLFRKSDLIGWKGKVHESPDVKGEFGYLKNPINHYTARNLKSMLIKSTMWAKVEAGLYYKAQNPKVTIIRVLKFSLSEFLTRYVLKKGFLDGKVGFISSLYQAIHNAMIMTYLWEIQNQSEEAFKKNQYE